MPHSSRGVHRNSLKFHVTFQVLASTLLTHPGTREMQAPGHLRHRAEGYPVSLSHDGNWGFGASRDNGTVTCWRGRPPLAWVYCHIFGNCASCLTSTGSIQCVRGKYGHPRNQQMLSIRVLPHHSQELVFKHLPALHWARPFSLPPPPQLV